MMPAGRYFIGDLCYVMHPQWDEFCHLTLSGNSVLNGVFQLENGVRFASLSTKFGDGCYEDETGGSYPVDAGLIGCIRVEDISDETADLSLGNIYVFEDEFEVYEEDGVLTFGYITINTGDDPDEDDEEDEEDEED